ncbi:MAG: dipeptide epimerase [Vulcanimicrobiaceae bacterium]
MTQHLALTASLLDLPLKHPFKIARYEEAVAKNVLVRVRHGGCEGLGEAAPSERYDESPESVISVLASRPFSGDDPFALESLLGGIAPPAARAGVDIALHDLIGKELGKPLYALLGLDPSLTPATSFTIGISDPETTMAKLVEVGEHALLKVKLGLGTPQAQVETVAAIRSRYTGTIRVDANEGWDVETSIHVLREMERYDVEFCEQPIPSGSPAGLKAIREATRIPIVVDEDAMNASDLPKLYGCVDGVNVKLAKCGGIRAALAMIHTARALGFKIMLGSMVESAIAATAAAHLSPLVDWADLDGPFLTANDPFNGLRYDRQGKMLLPGGPGLGVTE